MWIGNFVSFLILELAVWTNRFRPPPPDSSDLGSVDQHSGSVNRRQVPPASSFIDLDTKPKMKDPVLQTEDEPCCCMVPLPR